jgi:hypothetical protein
MRNIYTTGNTSLSFLDLLFGSLGAVVVLLIITLSIAGPPERIRDQVKRTIEWEIITNSNALTTVKITKSPGAELFKLNLTTGKLPPDDSFPFSLKTNKETLSENRSKYTFSLTFSGDDDEWQDSFNFLLELGGNTLHSASVTVSPGGDESSKNIAIKPNTLKNYYKLQTSIALSDKDGGGKMPKINKFEFE